jgi:hypothetical protein
MRWLYVSFDVPGEAAEAAAAVLAGRARLAARRAVGGHRIRSAPAGRWHVAHVQRVEGHVAVHFDLGVDDVAAALAWSRSAPQVSDFGIWRVMRSPGGLVFCLVPGGGESVPAPSVWPNGPQPARPALHRLARGLHDAEVAFWRAATGWRYEPSVLAEYGGKLFPPSPAPVRLLFQRLGDDDRDRTACTSISGPTTSRRRSFRVRLVNAQRRYEGDG